MSLPLEAAFRFRISHFPSPLMSFPRWQISQWTRCSVLGRVGEGHSCFIAWGWKRNKITATKKSLQCSAASSCESCSGDDAVTALSRRLVWLHLLLCTPTFSHPFAQAEALGTRSDRVASTLFRCQVLAAAVCMRRNLPINRATGRHGSSCTKPNRCNWAANSVEAPEP